MKKKHRKHQANSKQTSRPHFTLTRHPFSGVDPETIKAALIAMGAKKGEEFPALLGKVTNILKRRSALHILSILAGFSAPTPPR